MKKICISLLAIITIIPGLLLAQPGPGLGNLTYNSTELYKATWTYTEVNHLGSNIGTMQNGYLLTTFTPDSGKPPGGILVWDVSNPRKPLLVTRIYDSRTVTFREQHALPQHDKYVLFQDGFGFQVWDFSNPRNPVQTKRHVMAGYAHDDYSSNWQMFWQAPYIFIANGSRGFDVVDATNINNPVLVKHINTPRQIGPVYAVGNLLITTAHDFGKGFTIYDISNPRDPKLLNSFSNTENMYAGMLNGNKLVISARGNANNAIFGTYDVSDPVNIKKLGTLDIGNSGEQLYNSTQDNFIFQGCQNEVVKIDATNPTQLRIAGRGSIATGNVDHGQVSPFGNLIFVGNDHGSGSGFWVHQTAPDKKGPEVNMVVPKSNDVNRALTSRIGITLTDAILLETVNKNTFIVRPIGGAALSGKYSHQFSIVNFSPDQPLLPNTTYEIVIPAGGIKDFAGNTVGTTFTSYFSTGPNGNFPPGQAGKPWVFEDDKKIIINWNTISNSSKYVVKRSTAPNGPFQTIATVTQLTYADLNVSNDNVYYYTVTGENSFGQGTSSPIVRAMPSFYITSLNWTSATNAWGTVEKDQSNGEQATDDGNIITIGGVEYSRGLGIHANSTIIYNLDGKYDRFLSELGVDDEVGNSGSVIFTVSMDGKQLYTSGLMTGTSANKAIDVSVAGGKQLTLTVSQDADNALDHASWGGARLKAVTITGLEDAEADAGISVYPYPITNELTISSSKSISQVLLMDIQGNTLFQSNEEFSGNKSFSVKEYASSGVYLLKVKQQESIKTFKVIIQ
ncbi:MAG: NPCBM/NEW2 domain-containing protein [Opitutaceae bacterium]|nr:NPCBM/NEW2 domain-containing protein [Cytophagales bacterium]